MQNIAKKIFIYRWYIGILLFLLCIILELHGSSIGMYSKILHSPDIVLWGYNRPIRSDEWAVNTPLAFSQYYTNFNYWSDVVRGTITDMFMVYGQPIKDWSAIFRPFFWGYLFLNPGQGLSFFWMGRLIFLFLVSLEFGLLVCGHNKVLSFAYSLSITFAPIIQWWFDVVSLAEIFIFGQAGVLLLTAYFHTKNYKYRFFYTTILAWVAAVYTFAIYPAWQIPCAYIFLTVAVWQCYEQKRVTSLGRLDILFAIVLFGVFAGFITPIFQKSWETIQTVKATVYPGSRLCLTGGIGMKDLFSYGLGLWLPVKDLFVTTNNCEAARMFDLAPLGFLMACWCLWNQGKKDILLCMLLLLQIAFLGWGFLIWPVWFAKATLMSNVTARIILGIGIVNILLLVRALSLGIPGLPKKYISMILSLLGALIGTSFAYNVYPDIFNYKYLIATFLIVFISWYLAWQKKLKGFVLMIFLVAFYAGCRVNPVARGVDSIYQSPIVNKIMSMTKADKELWMVVDDGVMYNDVPIMGGAPTINSINVYPVLKRWQLLDVNGEYFPIYNRYAHISVMLDNKGPKFRLRSADAFEVHLNKNDLKLLQVKHILSTKKMDAFLEGDIKLRQVFVDKNLYIYNVEY